MKNCISVFVLIYIYIFVIFLILCRSYFYYFNYCNMKDLTNQKKKIRIFLDSDKDSRKFIIQRNSKYFTDQRIKSYLSFSFWNEKRFYFAILFLLQCNKVVVIFIFNNYFFYLVSIRLITDLIFLFDILLFFFYILLFFYSFSFMLWPSTAER